MADVVYNAYKFYLMKAKFDHSADTTKVMLVTSSYTPDQDAHDFRNDVTNEVAGTGYSSGGSALTTPTVTQDNTDNESVFDADDLTWGSSTITARGAVLYKSRGGASSADELICYFDFGSDKSSSNGNFTLQWHAEGIINIG